MAEELSYVVALLGARMHYAVPRLLHEHGILARLYVDVCATYSLPRLLGLFSTGLLPSRLRRLRARVPAGVPRRIITAFTRFGLDYQQRRIQARSESEMTAVHLWAGESFCRLILEADPPQDAGLYCFNSAVLEPLQHWRQAGQQTIVEQTIAPRRIEAKILRDEEQAFPDWEPPLVCDENIDAYMFREEAEWRHADVIVCGSKFVQSGVSKCGGAVERCVVLPYGIPLNVFPANTKSVLNGRALRVLTVGEVGLRKGSHYVLQAARRLNGRAEFRMVGPMSFLQRREEEIKRNISYVGVVPRSEIMNHFDWADIFLLPSLCEGSATVTYEALSAGLPVIATRSTGSILEDGVSGFIIPERNVDAIVGVLETFLDTPGLLREMSAAARKRSEIGGLEAYGMRLMSLISNM